MNHLKIAGKLGKPHGINGFITIHQNCNLDWENINTIFIELTNDQPPVPHLIEKTEFLPKKTIIKFKFFSSINEIKNLINKNFYVPENLIIQDNTSEFINYTVIDINNKNTLIGKITEHIIYGSVEFLVVLNEKQKEILLPINDVFIESIDINKKIIYYKGIEGMY